MKKRKAAEAANPLSLSGGKGKYNSHIKATISALFSAGRKMTAKDINQHTGSNDARKEISNLRKQGINIVDMVLPNRCKLYWLASDEHRQPSLFDDSRRVCETQKVSEVISEIGGKRL